MDKLIKASHKSQAATTEYVWARETQLQVPSVRWIPYASSLVW
jgi:hypothetical protein